MIHGTVTHMHPDFMEDWNEPNAITRACQERLARGLPLVDLTSTNPTRNGFIFPPEILVEESRKYFMQRSYEPDSRGMPLAREAIASWYNTRTPKALIDPNNIIITSGTSEAYSLLFSVLAEPGDNILAPDITYPLFEQLFAHSRIKERNYRLVETADGYSIDSESVLSVSDLSTRAIVTVSPHNPTGLIIKSPLKVFNDLHLPLICDEVFSEFTFGCDSAPPMTTLHEDFPVFMLNGISKMFALPDLKLSWIAMNSAAWNKFGRRLELLNDTFLSASYLTQFLLPAIFEKGMEFQAAMKKEIKRRTELALELLKGKGFKVYPPDGGYSLLINLKDEADEERQVLSLIERGVLIHPGYFYGCSGSPKGMISALSGEDTLRAGIELL